MLLGLHCVTIKQCCLLYNLRVINNGIHIYQLTFYLNFYTSVYGCGGGFGFEQKHCQIDGFE